MTTEETKRDLKLNVYQRLHEVMKRVSYVQKESKKGMRYSIVSHDAVTALVRPLLVEFGVVYTASVREQKRVGNMTEVLADVTFTNIDNPDDKITVTMLGQGIDDQDKGPGKAISYAVKYALLKTLGLETGDDPDQDQTAKMRDKHPASIQLATEEQQFELAELMESLGTPEAEAKKWLAKAGVDTFAHMPADTIQKCIGFLRSKQQPAGVA
jgi:hypothetical protein